MHDTIVSKKIVKDDGKSSTYQYAVVTAISVLIISIIERRTATTTTRN